MADNTTLNSGSGGDTVRDKDRAGVKTQIVGLDLNIGGASETLMQAGQQTMANSLPVVIASNQTAVPVSGTGSFTVDSELPAAAALADGAANPTTPTVGCAGLVFNGTTWDRARGDTANGLDVDVTRLPALPSGGNTIGNVGLVPQTAGGLALSRTLSAASTNATSIKASAGQVYGWYLSNSNASPRYVKLYNKASAPTVGTDTPALTLMVPGSGGANVEFAMGIPFGTGIALAITTGAADSDTGAVAANEVIAHILYK